MRYAFLFNGVGITVRHWVEPSRSGDEAGCRIQIQRLHEEPAPTRSAARIETLREPLWRADLFTLLAGAPGNWDRAHFHTKFAGQEPQGREWDPALTADPVSWARGQLTNLKGILRAAGAGDLAEQVDQGEVDTAMPALMAAVGACLAPHKGAARAASAAG